jgi:hypothetical protein
MMTKVTVYAWEKWNHQAGKTEMANRFGTKEAIDRSFGTIVGDGIEVDSSDLEGGDFTPIGYKPGS